MSTVKHFPFDRLWSIFERSQSIWSYTRDTVALTPGSLSSNRVWSTTKTPCRSTLCTIVQEAAGRLPRRYGPALLLWFIIHKFKYKYKCRTRRTCNIVEKSLLNYSRLL